MAKVSRLETRIDRLWREYLEARDRAARSRDIQDGIAAGRAWSAFTREFLAPEDRERLDAGWRQIG